MASRRLPETAYGEKSENKRGKGPPKGSGGAPTQSLKYFLAGLRRDAKTQNALRTALADPESKGFSAALRVLTEYDSSKPAQKQEHKHSGKVAVSFTRESKRRTAG